MDYCTLLRFAHMVGFILLGAEACKKIIGGDVVCLMPTKDNPNKITSLVAAPSCSRS